MTSRTLLRCSNGTLHLPQGIRIQVSTLPPKMKLEIDCDLLNVAAGAYSYYRHVVGAWVLFGIYVSVFFCSCDMCDLNEILLFLQSFTSSLPVSFYVALLRLN